MKEAPLGIMIFLIAPILMPFISSLFTIFVILIPALILLASRNTRTAPVFPFLFLWIFYQIWRGAEAAGAGAGVAYWAHIGGFLTGVIIMSLYKLTEARRGEKEREWEEIPATPLRF